MNLFPLLDTQQKNRSNNLHNCWFYVYLRMKFINGTTRKLTPAFASSIDDAIAQDKTRLNGLCRQLNR
jgi:hypothetical protein